MFTTRDRPLSRRHAPTAVRLSRASTSPDHPVRLEQCSGPAYPGPEPEISVVVATRDRATAWPQLISALEAQTLPVAAFEVVVVDDASRDDTWETLQKISARTNVRVLCLRLDVNVGSGAARTFGLDRCRAPVVAFTDDDCSPAPAWLEHLSAPLVAAYEDAGTSGLCAERRWEMALDALSAINLSKIIP